MPTWRCIPFRGEYLRHVGVYADGTLYNPNHYDEVLVRDAIQYALEYQQKRRVEAAQQAVITRRRRVEKRIYETAKEIVENRWRMRGPRPKCFICGKRLTDSESVARGIGPECWQHILRRVEAILHGASQQPPAA